MWIIGVILPFCQVDEAKLAKHRHNPAAAVWCNFKGAKIKLIGNRLWIVAP